MSTREIPTVRDLRGEIRHWRKGRASATWGEVISDVYIALFATAVLGSMLGNVLLNLNRLSANACTSSACTSVRSAMPWLVGLAALFVVVALARLLGPVFVTPATRSWLLATPVDRTSLLWPRLVGVCFAAAVTGGLIGVLAALFGGFGVAVIAAYAVGLGLLCLAIVGLAAMSQAHDGRGARRLSQILGGLLGVGLVVLAFGRAPALGAPASLSAAWIGGLAVAGILAVILLVVAFRRLPHLHDRDVSAGSSLAPAMSGALATLDMALLFDVLTSHRVSRIGAVRVRRNRSTGTGALVSAELTRLRRRPAPLLGLVAAALLTQAVASTGIDRVIPLVAGLCGFLAMVPLLLGVRVLTRTPSLERLLPFSAAEGRMASLKIPALLAMLYGVATVAAHRSSWGSDWVLALEAGLATGLVTLAGGVRWMTGKPPDYSRPLVSTPAGAVPPNLYSSAARGFDVVLLTTAPLLLWPTANGIWISAGLSLIVLAACLGMFSLPQPPPKPD